MSPLLLGLVGLLYLIVGVQGLYNGDIVGLAFIGYAIAQVAFVLRALQ